MHIMQLHEAFSRDSPPVTNNFWPRRAVKRGICYQNVCPSVSLSVTLAGHA